MTAPEPTRERVEAYEAALGCHRTEQGRFCWLHGDWSALGCPTAVRMARVEAERVAEVEAERDALAQAMWDGWEALGFDTDSDTEPGAQIAGARFMAGSASRYVKWAAWWLRDVRQHRQDDDDAETEWVADIAQRDRARDLAQHLEEELAQMQPRRPSCPCTDHLVNPYCPLHGPGAR